MSGSSAFMSGLDCAPLSVEMAQDAQTWTWADWAKRFPARMEAPHLVLACCPTTIELLKFRRHLQQENRMPRDGKLVCTVPYDSWSDVMDWLDANRFGGADFAMRYGAKDPMEIGRFQDWTIVAREYRR